MVKTAPVLRVALNTPLAQLFDYLPPATGPQPQPGQRIRVPFGRREQLGIIAGLANSSEIPAARLRRAHAILDAEPLLDKPLLDLLEWAAAYYQHPLGEVFAAALPAPLRNGAAPAPSATAEWQLTPAGAVVDLTLLERSARVQARVLSAFSGHSWLPESRLRETHPNWRKTIALLADKGWVVAQMRTQVLQLPAHADAGPALNADQQAAVAAVPVDGFYPCLLEGVTGSGKTEVYLHLIEQQLARGQQSLVLVPEIGLTPQLLERFRRRLRARIALMHSGLSDSQRLESWLHARDGSADVIIGTRSAVFIPLAHPGLIVVDEEHDSSYKQHEGFRYSARDLAVWRARQLDIPVVLGSATPALETVYNAREQRYRHTRLPERTGNARQPDVHVIDLRQYPPTDGLSQPLVAAMQRHLAAGGQALIYLNRRGFAPALICRDCGEAAECPRCDARMVLHQQRNRLICHHCGHERPGTQTCAACRGDMIAVGQGTERVEQALTRIFPDTLIQRMDRDSTRRRGEMERILESVRDGRARILLGTQMLTKGHDFPDVSLVGIVDSDQGLFGTDFRSSERLAQSLLQVSGRAGRGERPGEVWLQTWCPQHPLLITLLQAGYQGFADQALEERCAAGWPPYSRVALLRSECTRREQLFSFLEQAHAAAVNLGLSDIQLLGPATAPMERRSGRFRGQLLVRAGQGSTLQPFLTAWRAALAEQPDARRNRWSLDVDPTELF